MEVETIRLQPHKVHTPSFDGWGCSLCWWGNEYGSNGVASTLSDYFFSTQWNSNDLPGLGMNIVRYNIGGGGSNGYIDANTEENISSNNPTTSYRYMNEFWKNWFSDDPTNKGSWDWNADPRQLNILDLARQRGVNLVEFFSNSPPWWMCYNHSASGADGVFGLSGDNLQSWNYGQFAKYLAIVVQYFRQELGIPVNYIEPFNEPNAGWWTYPKDQEGCNFASSTQAAVLNNLAAAIADRQIQVGITASDENSMDQAILTLYDWSGFGNDPTGLLAKVNVHGYNGGDPYRGGSRSALRQLVGSRKLWMSEYGDSDTSGLTMATSIMLDMSQLQPDAWIYWQPIDWGWGFFSKAAPDDYGVVERKYHVFAQFSRHIKQGYSILDSDSPSNTIVAYSAAEKRLSIVYLKTGPYGYVGFDLSEYFKNIGGPVSGWITTTQPGNDGAPDYLYHQMVNNELTQQGTQVIALTYPQSITSINVENVY